MLTARIAESRGVFQPRLLALLSTFALTFAQSGWSEPPRLNERIDRAIAEAHVGPQAELASDSEFLRRIYLDLAGRIPSTEEARAFLTNTSPDRRVELIDHLLQSEECNRHLAVVFDVMWMERRADQHVTTTAWRDYLAQSFAENKPYDRLVAEVLSADGEDPTLRAAAKFYLDRDVESHALTRDVSRMFLGRDIQCAQCHDHPLVADYSQAEYHGLLAFLTRSYRFEKTNDKNEKVSLVAEKAEGEVSFASVFEPGSDKRSALPGFPSGIAVDDEPVWALEEAYQVTPDKNTAPVPRFSRRHQLAELATERQNDLFNRNAANRLWRLLMKQGLVEPPDFIHSDNHAIYPVLLNDLADAFAEMRYDIKRFLREVALSQAYQRSYLIPTDLAASFEVAERRLPSWQQEREYQQGVVERLKQDFSAADEALEASRQELMAVRNRVQQQLAERSKSVQQRSEADGKLGPARETQRQKSEILANLRLALEPAQRAAAQLTSDPQLTEATALLAQRTEALTAEIEKLQAEIAAQTQAREQATEAIATADREIEPARKELEHRVAATKQLSGARRALFRQLQSEQARALRLDHEIALAQDLIELQAGRETLVTLTQQKAELEATEPALQDEQRLLADRLLQTQTQQETAVGQRAAGTQAAVEKDQQLMSLQQLSEGIRAAAEQLAASTALLPGDVELSAIHDRLQSRLATLDEQAAGLREERTELSETIARADAADKLAHARTGDDRSRAGSDDRSARRARGRESQAPTATRRNRGRFGSSPGPFPKITDRAIRRRRRSGTHSRTIGRERLRGPGIGPAFPSRSRSRMAK